MKFNRKEHCRFVQWLDRTAEKNPVLWLPCVILLIIALGAEQICGIVSTAFPRREKARLPDTITGGQLTRKPFALRVVAMSLVLALGFMTVPELSEVISVVVFADDTNDLTLGYSENTDDLGIEAYSDSDAIFGDFSYTILNGDVTITGYNGTDAEVVIPDTIEGLPVTLIGEEAFANDWNIIKITIPESVTVLGNKAFKGCNYLNEINIPNTVESIGDMAFWECNNLIDIVIPKNVVSIGNYSFAYCQNLSNIEILNSKTYIGKGAFVWCHKLQKFTVPQDISIIEDYAFFDCENLKEITIPYGVISIGERAFEGCREIAKVSIPDSVTSIESYTFKGCLNLTIYGVPRSYAETYAKENNIPFKDISEFDGSNDSQLTAKYTDGTDADINNLSMFETCINFYISTKDFDAISELVSNDVCIREYSSDDISDVATNLYYDNFDENKYTLSAYNIYKLTPSTTYYIDLSNVSLNGEYPFQNIDCKKTLKFTTGFGLTLTRDNFYIFNNSKDNFVGNGESNKYQITSTFYENEIATRLDKNVFGLFYKLPIKWEGSCFGMSSVMVLTNSNQLNRVFINNVEQQSKVSEYGIPKDTKYLPYGSRDLINYYQIMQSICGNESNKFDTLTLATVFSNASKIQNFNDVFLLTYSYFDPLKSQRDKHTIVVLGCNGNTLYVYDPNDIYYYKLFDKYKFVINENGKVYMNTDATEVPIHVYGLSYVPQNRLTKIKPDTKTTYITYKIPSHISATPRELNIKDRNSGKSSTVFDDCSFNGNMDFENLSFLSGDENYEDESNDSIMVITMPFELNQSFEVTTNDKAIGFAVANAEMLLSVNADKADKSIISAKDSVKLINAIGNFELTVSTDNMPYDMFDISGTANGDVDCQYSDNGVLVNLDNTSDTTVTFYRDLETEEHTVPAEYDKFIIGEENNEEAILVDTDGDGNYETDILNNDVHTHIPSDEYSSDDTGHWHSCTLCNEKLDFAAHTENRGTVTVKPTAETEGTVTYSCTVCGYVMRTETIPVLPPEHTHSFGTDWKFDSTSHWHECSCGEKSDLANHRENEGVVTLQPTTTSTGIRTYSCRDCGYVMRTETIPEIPEEHTHSFGTHWVYDSTKHWHECSCGERSDTATHTENSGVVTVQPTTSSTGTMTYSCTVCGYVTRTETIPATKPSDPTPSIPTPPNPIIPSPTYPAPGAEALPPVLTSNKNIDVSLTSDLKDLAKGEAHISTKRRFFESSAEIRLTNTEESEAAGKRALERLDNNSLICYPFDISVYTVENGSKMQLAAGGYITFEIPVPKSMETNAVSIEIYHIPGGVPEHIESEIITDKYDNLKIVFTASEFSPYMFTTDVGEDISSGAGVTAGSISVDMTSPVTNGVSIPTAKLPHVLRYSGKKRRYRILRRRRLDNLIFIY